jgi:hypothetical protein
MLRALLIAVSGIVYFILSLLIFLPFRMKPVENYNLFALPILAVIFLGLFYKACTAQKESRGYLFGFYGGILMWQVVGEIPFIEVPKGTILQFSDLNIKMLGGYYYALAGWILLHILWRTGTLKNTVAFLFAVFMGIWTFELYMDNYSFRVPLAVMSQLSTVIMLVFIIVSIVLLLIARKAATIEKKNVIGGILYITLSIVIMASGQWKKPQDFYIKYESAGIPHEIEGLKEELDYIEQLKTKMALQSYMTPNQWANMKGYKLPK